MPSARSPARLHRRTEADYGQDQHTHPNTFQDGYLHPGDTPGIGVTVDKEAAAKFEYRPAYLPVNRLRDGTVHDW